MDYAQIRPSFGHFFDYNSLNIEDWKKIFVKLSSYRTENFCVYFNVKKYEKIFNKNTGRNYNACHAQSFKATAITATGDVYVCCSLSGVEDAKIGSIYHNTFSEIWGGENRKKIIKNINVKKCPELCIGDELNEFLENYKNNPPMHSNFL